MLRPQDGRNGRLPARHFLRSDVQCGHHFL